MLLATTTLLLSHSLGEWASDSLPCKESGNNILRSEDSAAAAASTVLENSSFFFLNKK